MRTQITLVATLCFCLAGGVQAEQVDWERKLNRNDADEIYKTIVEIGKRRHMDAVLPLIKRGANARSPHIAVAVGESLAQMDQAELSKSVIRSRDFQKLTRKLLTNKDGETKKNLARIFGTWGHPWVDGPLAKLASGRRSPDVQEEALHMCGSIRLDTPTSFPEVKESIRKALKGRSGLIKAAACSAAGRLGLRELQDGIARIVRIEKDKYAGLYAVWALKQMGWSQGIGSFKHVATKSPKLTTKEANLKAITELSTLRDIPDLLTLSKHSDDDLRDAAVLALGRMPWRAWRKKKAEQRRRAENGSITPRGGEEPVVVHEKGLPDPQLDVPPGVIDRLIQIVISDSSWEVRDAARQGLLRFGKIAQPKVRAAMPAVVGSSDDDASLTAAELCGLFECTEARDELIKIARHDTRAAHRMFAARALEGLDAAVCVKELTKELRPRGRKTSKDVELHSVQALGYVRHIDAYSFLIGMFEMEGWPEDILREAEFSLERLTGHRFGRKPKRWAFWMASASNPLHPGIGTFDRSKNRAAAIQNKMYGVTASTERAVENGLRWLDLQQEPLGYWDGNKHNGIIACEPAYTGLSLLSLLGAGYNSASGKYRETIRRGTEFLAATQFYDGGFPVTGGGDDSWIFAYMIGMGIWGVTESYALSGDELFAGPAQWGIDYLVRVQTPGAGWRYSGRAYQSDTSCTSWVLMATKMAALAGLDVAQKSWDGIDSWLTRCTFDLTGEEEVPEDLATDYDHEVGHKRLHKSFTGYFTLSGHEKSALRAVSMTAVGMVCRFFMGWKRSHPYMIGASNFLRDYLPRWMKGLEGQSARWYFYYWYYGTLAMHQMGGRHWAVWNEKIKKVLPKHQLLTPPNLQGAWPADAVRFGGGRLLSTPLAIMTLETYYRFSPLLGDQNKSDAPGKDDPPGKDEPPGKNDAPGEGENEDRGGKKK